MTKPYATGPRKKSPRGKGLRAFNHGVSIALKALWKTPEYREKMKLRQLKIAELRKLDPAKFNRHGVPDGMRRAQAEPLWARARELADRFISIMKEKGELPEDTFVEVTDSDGEVSTIKVPATDGGKAEAALHECFVLAVGPTDNKIKIQALNTVLAYTRAKPESKSKLTLEKAEDFLAEIAKDDA